MSTDTASTRRSFVKVGALLAAPLAVAAPVAAMAGDERAARLARLEDEAAIRAVHQAWLRRVNTGEDAAFDKAVRSLAPDLTGEPDAIEVAADGARVAGRFACVVELETAIPQDCTPAQMAHAQGGGLIRRTERRLLKADYVKTKGVWTIAKVELAEV